MYSYACPFTTGNFVVFKGIVVFSSVWEKSAKRGKRRKKKKRLSKKEEEKKIVCSSYKIHYLAVGVNHS